MEAELLLTDKSLSGFCLKGAAMNMKSASYLFTILLGILTAVSACSFLEEKGEQKRSAESDSSELVMLSGFDTEGRERSCPEVVCPADTSVSSPPASFTDRCVAENRVVKTCACGDYICVDPSTLPPPPSVTNKKKPGEGAFTGYDRAGKHVSCTHSGQEMACTAIFGPEEEFAQRCVEAGHQKYECACHDYLCSAPVK